MRTAVSAKVHLVLDKKRASIHHTETVVVCGCAVGNAYGIPRIEGTAGNDHYIVMGIGVLSHLDFGSYGHDSAVRNIYRIGASLIAAPDIQPFGDGKRSIVRYDYGIAVRTLSGTDLEISGHRYGRGRVGNGKEVPERQFCRPHKRTVPQFHRSSGADSSRGFPGVRSLSHHKAACRIDHASVLDRKGPSRIYRAERKHVPARRGNRPRKPNL